MTLSLVDRVRFLGYYFGARRLSAISDRDTLVRHQQSQLARLRRRILARSPFYAPFARAAFEELPILGKREWMAHFDAINTVGIRLSDASRVAEQAERDRNFRPMIGDVTVGLSTGTSGARGIFLAGPAERLHWAAALLAKVFPKPLPRVERIALLLRAGSNLYESLTGKGRIRFRFFDLSLPFEQVLDELGRYAPTILAGPAHVLADLARQRAPGSNEIRPARIFAVAEVLDDMDREQIEIGFGLKVEQIYQATEGFLGITCARGTLHLNEDLVLIEKEWCDAERRRFVPVVTDLYRTTQPVVRYRLNDVLLSATPCACGSPRTALERIEGREDDVVRLPSATPPGMIPVWPDLLTRAIVRAAPNVSDYEIVSRPGAGLLVRLAPWPLAGSDTAVRSALDAAIRRLGAQVPKIEIAALERAADDHLQKRRRVRSLPPDVNRA